MFKCWERAPTFPPSSFPEYPLLFEHLNDWTLCVAQYFPALEVIWLNYASYHFKGVLELCHYQSVSVEENTYRNFSVISVWECGMLHVKWQQNTL